MKVKAKRQFSYKGVSYIGGKEYEVSKALFNEVRMMFEEVKEKAVRVARKPRNKQVRKESKK